MLAEDKTIYFVLGDINAPVLPAAPQSKEAKEQLLQAYVLVFKEFLVESAENISDETIKAASESTLKAYAAAIGERMKNDSGLVAQYAQAGDYEQIAKKWKELALASDASDAGSVAAYCDAVVAQKHEAISILEALREK